VKCICRGYNYIYHDVVEFAEEALPYFLGEKKVEYVIRGMI